MGIHKEKSFLGKTIGIIGTATGVGVTHLALSLSNFLVIEQGKRVMLADFSAGRELGHVPVTPKKCAYGVTYAVDWDIKRMPQLMNEAFDFLILDFGSDWQNNREEFLRCSKKIVLGSLQPWKKEQYDRRMQELEKETGFEHWDYCALFGEKEEKKYFMQTYHLTLRLVPFFENPYRLGKKEFLFLQEFTGDF